MRLTIGDIVVLAKASPVDGAAAIKQLYDWHHSLWKTGALALLAGAVSMLATLAVSALKAEFEVPTWQAWTTAGAAGVVALLSAAALVRVARLEREYTLALVVFSLTLEGDDR